MTHESTMNEGKFTMQRLDNYFNSVNSKAAFYIVIQTFLLGGLCTGYISLYGKNIPAWQIVFFTAFHLLCCLGSILYTLIAMNPFTKSHFAKERFSSLLFFGSIARYSCSEFQQKFVSQTDESRVQDMSSQIHCLAIGLDKKYKRLKIASTFLFIQFLFLLPYLYIIIKNYQS